VLNQFCRKEGIKFIAAPTAGVFSSIFCDFGDEFLVVDKDGEQLIELMI